MAKINQAAEKTEKNAAYALALKMRKKKEDPKGKKEKPKPKFANWCRGKGHPPSCWVSTCPNP